MRVINNFIFVSGLLGVFIFSASAGEIKPGAVPGSLNYHGRLERDNTPVTGPVHLSFRIYNAAEGGTLRWPTADCPSSEIMVTANQGIFSASIAPCWDVFSRAEQLYLEVQVESDVLTPREPLNSVAYAIVARKLEDGSSVSVTTLTAAYQVLLATVSGNVGIGSMAVSSDKKLTVNGGIRVLSDGYYFPDGTVQNTAGVAGAGNLANPSDAILMSDSDDSGAGDIILQTASAERARVSASNGNLGVGVAAPSERLEVSGNISNTAGNFVIYPRDYLVSRPRTAANAVFRLMPRDNDSPNSAALELYKQVDTSTGTPVNYTRGVAAMTANGLEFYQEKGGTGQNQPMIFKTGVVEGMRIIANGNVSVGNYPNPTDNFQSAGDISTSSGIRGGQVSIGDYSTWTNIPNEVRSEAGYHLLLQQTNSYNVGIGIDSPKEKLHVRGSVLSDYGVIAATGAFSSTVTVGGNFTANSEVHLSATVIYGTLKVTGVVESDQGFPGYLASTQTFTGLNAFTNPVAALSDILVSNRLGIGVADFSFAPSEYLQIGDGLAANDDASAYLLSGSGTGNSRLYFYRGPAEAARFETRNGNNLALVAGNTKSLVDNTYYRIYNSVFWVANGTNNITPVIFVSSWMGNVGIGTAVLDSDSKLTVSGNLRIAGPASNGIIFAGGAKLTSANPGGVSVGAVTHNEDAVVQSDADLDNTGKVVLRAGMLDGLVLSTGGNVGIGTQYPVSRLNLRGGDLALGTPYNPYASDDTEDLLIGGNLAVNGNIEQRSASTVIFIALTVTNNVSLSTAPGGKTGIGTNNPQYKLDVLGDINMSGVLRSGGTQRMSAGGVLSNATWNGAIAVPYGGTGAATLTGVVHAGGVSAFTAGNVALTSEVSGILPAANGGTGVDSLTGVVHASGVSVFTAGNVALTSEVSGILPAANGGTGSNLGAAAAGAAPYFSGAGVTSALAAGAADYLLQANGAAAPGWVQSTRSNVEDTIVRRDAGGDFAARNITAVTFGGTASTATHLAGGGLGSAPYQSAANTTAMLGAAPAADYLLRANGAAAPGWVQSTDGNLGNTIVRRDGYGSFSGNAITADKFEGTFVGGANYIQKTVGTNDYVRVRGFDAGFNAGYLEIATANNGDEPIYVRQYTWGISGSFDTVVRSVTLLNASGHAIFEPGDVYSKNLNMTADVRTDNPEYLVGEWDGSKFLRYISPDNITMGNADIVDGLHAAASGVAPGANQYVRTDGSAVAYVGWLNTVSGNNGTTAINRVYASHDNRLRYYTLANFTDQIRTTASGAWDINVSGADDVTGIVAVANGGTGNTTGLAATATALATARTINTVAFDGTANITIYDSSKVPTTRQVNGYALSTDVILNKSDVGLGSADNTADSVKAVLSATKLATARTINGVSFDGTGNITAYDGTKAALGTASVGKFVCLKTGGTDLGYCANDLDPVTGVCTCN